MNKATIKTVLAWIGGLWVGWQVLQFLIRAGVLHVTGVDTGGF